MTRRSAAPRVKVRVADAAEPRGLRLGRSQSLVMLAGFAVFVSSGLAIPVRPVGAAGGTPSAVVVATAVLALAGLVTALGTFAWALVRSSR